MIARPFSENVTPRTIDWFGPVCGCTSVICPAGAKLEKNAQGFGESIWDGMKSVGRSLQKFFTGG